MIVVLCEGALDMEFLACIFENKGFKRIKHEKNYIYKKLGLKYQKYIVLRNKEELVIFYPKSGGYKAVLNTAKDISTQIDWKRRGVARVILAIDLDDKDVKNRLTAIEDSLKSVYDVEKRADYTFKCTKNAHEFLFTVVPLGDLNLQRKINIIQEKCMIEDLILSLILIKDKYRELCEQSIELYEHKIKEKPNQKALLRMLESFCKNPEKGAYEFLSELKEELWTILPEHVRESIEESTFF